MLVCLVSLGFNMFMILFMFWGLVVLVVVMVVWILVLILLFDRLVGMQVVSMVSLVFLMLVRFWWLLVLNCEMEFLCCLIILLMMVSMWVLVSLMCLLIFFCFIVVVKRWMVFSLFMFLVCMVVFMFFVICFFKFMGYFEDEVDEYFVIWCYFVFSILGSNKVGFGFGIVEYGWVYCQFELVFFFLFGVVNRKNQVSQVFGENILINWE